MIHLFKRKWNCRFLFLPASLLVACLFFVFFAYLCSSGIDGNAYSLEKNWKITDSDSTYESASLLDYKVPSDIKVGSTIVFENVLDANVPQRSTFKFRSYHSKTSVFLDDECLYSYGYDLKKSVLTGSGFSYVNMPDDVAGKKLKIVFEVRETAAANTSLTAEFLPNKTVSDYSARHAVSLCTGVFLGIFGVFLVCSGILALAYKKSFLRLILIGIFAFLMGTWTLCYTKTIQVFSMDFSINTYMEYISLYLGPVVFEALLYYMFYKRLETWKRVGLLVCLAFGVLFVLFTTVLQILDIAHYPLFLLPFHCYILASLIFLVAARIIYNRRAGLQEKIVASGLVVFLVFAATDLLRFNFLKYFGFFENFLNMTILPIGTLLFILFLVASFVVYVYSMVKEMSEKEILAQLAYRDVLTGLYNRAKCESIFEILDAEKKDYAIVSVDLNGLKKVNDTYGHSSGDKFLSKFAKAFKDAFAGIGTTIRMGGDEFVAVVRSEHLGDLNDALMDMLRNEKRYSSKLPVPLDASYGVAYRGTGESVKAMDVYQSADAQMYVMKMASKKGRE